MPGAVNLGGLDKIIKDIKAAVSTSLMSVDLADATRQGDDDFVFVEDPKDVILRDINIGFGKIREVFQGSKFSADVDRLINQAFASFKTWVDSDFADMGVLGEGYDDDLASEEKACRAAIDQLYVSLHDAGEKLFSVDDKKKSANAGGISQQPPKQWARTKKSGSPWERRKPEGPEVAEFAKNAAKQARQAKLASQEKLAMLAQKTGAQQERRIEEKKSQIAKGMAQVGFFGPLGESSSNRATGPNPNGYAAKKHN